jgi:hypothetical protein
MGIELKIKKSLVKDTPGFYVKALRNQTAECTFTGNTQGINLSKALESGWTKAPSTRGSLILGKGFYSFGGFKEGDSLYPRFRVLIDQFGDLWFFPSEKYLRFMVAEINDKGESTISDYAVFYREISEGSGVIPMSLLNSIALNDELEFQSKLAHKLSYNKRRLDARIPAIGYLALASQKPPSNANQTRSTKTPSERTGLPSKPGTLLPVL